MGLDFGKSSMGNPAQAGNGLQEKNEAHLHVQCYSHDFGKHTQPCPMKNHIYYLAAQILSLDVGYITHFFLLTSPISLFFCSC